MKYEEETRAALERLFEYYEKIIANEISGYIFDCPLCDLYHEEGCTKCPWKIELNMSCYDYAKKNGFDKWPGELRIKGDLKWARKRRDQIKEWRSK